MGLPRNVMAECQEPSLGILLDREPCPCKSYLAGGCLNTTLALSALQPGPGPWVKKKLASSQEQAEAPALCNYPKWLQAGVRVET